MIRQLSRRQALTDAAIALAALLLFGLPDFRSDGQHAEALVSLGLAVAILFRRRWTLLSLGLAWLTCILEMALGTWPVVAANVLVVVVLASTGASASRLTRRLGLASALLGAACVTGYTLLGPSWISDRYTSSASGLAQLCMIFVATAAVFLLAWTVGFVSRVLANGREQRAAAAEAEREVAAEQERSQIARDMHDVVAHSLAVVIAQADGARYLREQDPEAVDAALTAIAATAREALGDVRELLAQLRHDQGRAPQPELAELDRLYAQFRSAGLKLAVHETGVQLPLRSSSQLAVFRIVQESLTNALRHGDASEQVEVSFDWSADALQLTVLNTLRRDGVGTSGRRDEAGALGASGGHGLPGMTERAALAGGRLEAAAVGSRFLVRAWLPGRVEPGTDGTAAAGSRVGASMPAPTQQEAR